MASFDFKISGEKKSNILCLSIPRREKGARVGGGGRVRGGGDHWWFDSAVEAACVLASFGVPDVQ